MFKFKYSVIIYFCISWLVSHSSSMAMEQENVPLVPRTPYACFSLKTHPLPIEVQQKYSTNIRVQLIEIYNLSNSKAKLIYEEKGELLNNFKNCFLWCQDWGHPAKVLFNEMITFMESKKNPAHFKLKKAAKACFENFLRTPTTKDQIDVIDMKLMFLTKDCETKPKHYKKNSTEIVQLVEILNDANRCEITGCYLQGISTEKLFGIDDLYFDEEGVKPNPLQINKSGT